MSFRTILIIINLVFIAALIGFIVYRVVSLRRNPHHREPENLTPFFDDDVMEGAHLERALGVALIALVVILLGMVVYFMREPFRADEASAFFKDQSVERGAVLFSAPQSEDYNSTVSLQCARCHGLDGGGGAAFPTIVKSTDPRCNASSTARRTSTKTGPTACRSRCRGRHPTCSLRPCGTPAPSSPRSSRSAGRARRCPRGVC